MRSLVTLSLLEEVGLTETLQVEKVRDVEETLGCRFGDNVLCLFAESHLEMLGDAGIALDSVVERTRAARQTGLAPDYVAVGRTHEETFLAVPVRPAETAAELYLYDVASQSTRPISVGRWLEERIGRIREGLRASGADQGERVESSPTDLQIAKYRPDMVPEPPEVTKVRHPKFGVGTVLREHGSGESTKLEIEFDDETRTILAEYVESV